ncbi:MAG: FAD-dependent monooxygenase [Cyclobacteriaceae bacterium]
MPHNCLSQVYDVVILGGGPAGLSTAVALRRLTSLSVAVYEAAPPGTQRIGESCPPDILMLLSQLGLADAFRSGPHMPFPGFASLWGSPRVGYNDFITSPLGSGWRLDRPAFDTMLAEAAQAAGADVCFSTRFISATPLPGGGHKLQLKGKGGDKPVDVTARYVVDATGARARFAASVGIAREQAEELSAYVQFAKVEQGTLTGRVLLESKPYGWWYCAALPGNQVVTMLVAEADTVSQLRNDKQGELYRHALENTHLVGPSLHELSLSSPHAHTWPVVSGCLPQVQGRDWIAVGDAAASYDPVPAQGIYKALSHGIAAAKEMAAIFDDESYTPGQYQTYVYTSYQTYLQHRHDLYARELRWQDAEFWRNRLARRAEDMVSGSEG